MNILLLTRSLWSETPRIRHQLANLLRSQGNLTAFVEKPTFVGRTVLRNQETGLHVWSASEAIHHQLRFSNGLRSLNRRHVKASIARIASSFGPDAVVNFNYDYGFLRDTLFSKIPFVTLINDDFHAGAKPWMKRQVLNELRETIQSSDCTLCVSHPLCSQAREFGKRVELFLPWADKAYCHPVASSERNVVLYYGYVNGRIRWDYVEILAANGYNLRIVGPANDKAGQMAVARLGAFSNVEYLSSRPLDQVPLNDVCCSIAPYDTELATVRACTVTNRVFQLLSRGIPLAILDLPHFISASPKVIARAKSLNELEQAINSFMQDFDASQPEIARFLLDHQPEARYQQLMEGLDASGIHPSAFQFVPS